MQFWLQEAARAEADRAGREVDELQAEAADLRRQLEVLQGQVKDMQVRVLHGAVLLRGSLLLVRCIDTHSTEQLVAEARQLRRQGACKGSPQMLRQFAAACCFQMPSSMGKQVVTSRGKPPQHLLCGLQFWGLWSVLRMGSLPARAAVVLATLFLH